MPTVVVNSAAMMAGRILPFESLVKLGRSQLQSVARPGISPRASTGSDRVYFGALIARRVRSTTASGVLTTSATIFCTSTPDLGIMSTFLFLRRRGTWDS